MKQKEDEHADNDHKEEYDQNEHSKFWTEKLEHQDALKPMDKVSCRIMRVLMQKFNRFAAETRIVRLDDISYNLRHHFMVKVGSHVKDNRDIFRISLKKIQRIFVNVEEIYLHNYYRLDDALLDDIIEFLKMNGNKDQIKQIKFLYYDYSGNINDETDAYDNNVYLPINKLSQHKLRALDALGWECIEKEQKKKNTDFQYGVKIRLKPKDAM